MPKTVLVIGASRGIGKELIHLLAEKELSVHGFARSFEDKEVDGISFHRLDLNDSGVKEQLNNILLKVDQIDYLINNAGHIVVKPFLELTRDDIQNCYSVNVIGIMEVIQACIPRMRSGSHIVNISSIGGFQGSVKFPGLSAYSTSKAALVSLTELLAEEFKESGIAINCLCLGAVQTEMLETAFPGYTAPHTAKEMAKYIVDFTLNGANYFKGKIIPVSISTP